MANRLAVGIQASNHTAEHGSSVALATVGWHSRMLKPMCAHMQIYCCGELSILQAAEAYACHTRCTSCFEFAYLLVPHALARAHRVLHRSSAAAYKCRVSGM